MEKSLTKSSANGLAQYSSIPAIEEFTKRLNSLPTTEEVQVNNLANNSKYLPISFIQTKLDEHFAGLWQTRNFTTKVVANEIVGEIELHVYHPVLREWIVRTGCAATQIQMKSEKNGGTGDITNIGEKIKNTLTKDYPHLYAECVKSAAKTLGKAFGRDLNRQFEDSYQPIYSNEIEANEALAEIKTKMESCKSVDELLGLFNQYPDLHQNPQFRKEFTYFRSKLNRK